MIYGIVSEKGNETPRTVFRSKKITDNQIYYISQLGVLVERLQSDDIIYCIISVDRFLRVSQYVVFCEKVLHAGVSLRCLEQPYLDIGYGRHWRSSVVSQLNTMVRAEGVTANRLYSDLELSDKGRNYVSRCIVDTSFSRMLF